jgi:hypothetical protein
VLRQSQDSFERSALGNRVGSGGGIRSVLAEYFRVCRSYKLDEVVHLDGLVEQRLFQIRT